MTAEKTKNEPSFALVAPSNVRVDDGGITVALDVTTNDKEFAQRAVADLAESTGGVLVSGEPRPSQQSATSHAIGNWGNCEWEPTGSAWNGKAGTKKFVQ